MGTQTKISDIHTAEDQSNGVPVMAPGIYGLLGGALLARPEKVAWLENQGYVAIDTDQGVCAFTEAGATWLEDATDDIMDEYFYRPAQDFSDVLGLDGDATETGDV